MTRKFLYGKKQFLSPIIDGITSLRFSDISHYSRLENKKMRDDEMRKDFVIDKNSVTIEVNGHTLDSESFSEDPVISFPVQHCYCLCLTDKGNDPELFEIQALEST